jgi:hypothetical protein
MLPLSRTVDTAYDEDLTGFSICYATMAGFEQGQQQQQANSQIALPNGLPVHIPR